MAGFGDSTALVCAGGVSTGPKTAEGKARSAQNIIKYNDKRISNNRKSDQ